MLKWVEMDDGIRFLEEKTYTLLKGLEDEYIDYDQFKKDFIVKMVQKDVESVYQYFRQ